MHSKILISILVLVAELCLKRVVSDDDGMSESQKTELASKLNTLVRHKGWQLLKVRISRNGETVDESITDPISVILNDMWFLGDRDPVKAYNVSGKYHDIWTVLTCKYAEIISNYMTLLGHLIEVCENQKTTAEFCVESYYACFNSMLVKLHSVSPRFKCMTDALELIHSMGRQLEPQLGVLIATRELSEFTGTVGPRTTSKLTEAGRIDREVIDSELKIITDYISDVYDQKLHSFYTNRCIVPAHREWTLQKLNDHFRYAKSKQLIPPETTMWEHAKDQIDYYVDEIFGSCFFDLGFAIDGTGQTIIANS